jgi:hypothetical protein
MATVKTRGVRLKQEMKATQVHGIYLTREQHLRGGRLVGYGSRGMGLALGYWASDEFRVMLEQNRENW